MKINVNDDDDTDIQKYFDSVADFIQRVEDCKGKVYIYIFFNFIILFILNFIIL